jgi:hypothetical protein
MVFMLHLSSLVFDATTSVAKGAALSYNQLSGAEAEIGAKIRLNLGMGYPKMKVGLWERRSPRVVSPPADGVQQQA